RKSEYEKTQVEIRETSFLKKEGQKNLSEDAITYLDSDKFIEANKLNKANNIKTGVKEELKIEVKDVNIARKYAYEFPLIQEMGMGEISAQNQWVPQIGKFKGQSGKQTGWKKTNAAGDSVTIRIDWD